jgi:hypothetical protein
MRPWRSTTASRRSATARARSIGAVLVFHDMSRERQYATRLAHLASHDP